MTERNRIGPDTGVTLVASAARTVTGNSGTLILPLLARANLIALILDLTAISGTGATLDVGVSTSFDGGARWVLLAKFSQLLLAGSAKQKVIKLACKDPLTSGFEVEPVATPTISGAAAVSNYIWDAFWRVDWVCAGTTPSFTFSVKAMPLSVP